MITGGGSCVLTKLFVAKCSNSSIFILTLKYVHRDSCYCVTFEMYPQSFYMPTVTFECIQSFIFLHCTVPLKHIHRLRFKPLSSESGSMVQNMTCSQRQIVSLNFLYLDKKTKKQPLYGINICSDSLT